MLDKIIDNSYKDLDDVFKEIDKVEEFNSEKILNAFTDNNVCETDGVEFSNVVTLESNVVIDELIVVTLSFNSSSITVLIDDGTDNVVGLFCKMICVIFGLFAISQ